MRLVFSLRVSWLGEKDALVQLLTELTNGLVQGAVVLPEQLEAVFLLGQRSLNQKAVAFDQTGVCHNLRLMIAYVNVEGKDEDEDEKEKTDHFVG